MGQQALSPFQRLVYKQGALLSDADLSTDPTFTLNLQGGNSLVLYVYYTRGGSGAATAVSFSGTVVHPNVPSTAVKITGASQDSGALTRSAWSDTYAVSDSDAWQVIVPVAAGQAVITVTAADATSDDTISVYAAEAS